MTWRLRQRGYRVIEKRWKCELAREKRENRENREMHNFLENHPMLINLSRRSLVAVQKISRYEVTGTEKIRYVGMCSLCPYILKTVFPLGQSTIYIGEQCSELIGVALNFNFNSVEGIIRCTVLPPRDLCHPVFPYRIQGKLLFVVAAKRFCRMHSRSPRR